MLRCAYSRIASKRVSILSLRYLWKSLFFSFQPLRARVEFLVNGMEHCSSKKILLPPLATLPSPVLDNHGLHVFRPNCHHIGMISTIACPVAYPYQPLLPVISSWELEQTDLAAFQPMSTQADDEDVPWISKCIREVYHWGGHLREQPSIQLCHHTVIGILVLDINHICFESLRRAALDLRDVVTRLVLSRVHAGRLGQHGAYRWFECRRRGRIVDAGKSE